MNNTALQRIEIICTGVSKSYNRESVFRAITLECLPGETIAITGPNGSGKSTLLSLLSGFSAPTDGVIHWHTLNGETIPADSWYKYLSIAAPYIDLIDEFTVHEMASFHAGFKPLFPETDINTLVETAMLTEHAHKSVKSLSSGMKQRLKLTLALLSYTPVLLLDEPTSNLDIKGKEWFAKLLNLYSKDRLVIIATNEPFDTSLCSRTCDIVLFK